MSMCCGYIKYSRRLVAGVPANVIGYLRDSSTQLPRLFFSGGTDDRP